MLVLVLVVYCFQILRIWNKSFSDKSMDERVLANAVFAKLDIKISVSMVSWLQTNPHNLV